MKVVSDQSLEFRIGFRGGLTPPFDIPPLDVPEAGNK
jgi:hypothetical protein